ncbi:MAG: helix-turn-helix domain-containing protein [Lachnospiraceae bacterium]
MKEKRISQYKLIHQYGVSSGQLNRLKHNVHVSTHTLDMLCGILECKIEEVIEYHNEGQ